MVDGGPMLLGLGAATLAAPRRRSTSTWPSCSSPARCSSAPIGRWAPPIDGVGPEAVRAALPYLQRAALTPHVRDLAAP